MGFFCYFFFIITPCKYLMHYLFNCNRNNLTFQGTWISSRILFNWTFHWFTLSDQLHWVTCLSLVFFTYVCLISIYMYSFTIIGTLDMSSAKQWKEGFVLYYKYYLNIECYAVKKLNQNSATGLYIKFNWIKHKKNLMILGFFLVFLNFSFGGSKGV